MVTSLRHKSKLGIKVVLVSSEAGIDLKYFGNSKIVSGMRDKIYSVSCMPPAAADLLEFMKNVNMTEPQKNYLIERHNNFREIKNINKLIKDQLI